MKQKITKRAAALALAVMLCLTACFTAFAEGKTYTVKECDNLQITLPDNMAAVTRSSAADDRFFTLHGLDYNQVMSDFQSGDIYLQAMDDVEAVTVTLSYLESEQSKSIGNYNKLSGSELQQIAQNFIAASGTEIRYNSATLDQAESSAVWIYFNMSTKTADGKTVTQYQASTVYNGKNISVTYYRNGGSVTADDYNILSGIVGSVTFGGNKNFFENLLSMNNMTLYIIIGCAVLAIILLIIIIVAVSKSKKRKKKSKNDKILQELAGKYQTNRGNSYPENEPYYEEEPQQRAYESEPSRTYDDSYGAAEAPVQQDISTKYDDYSDYEDGITRKYSDEDIDRLLGDIEDKENFNDALPAAQADSEIASEVRDSVIAGGVIAGFVADEAGEPREKAPETAEDSALTAYNEEVEEDSPEASYPDEELSEAADEAPAGVVFDSEPEPGGDEDERDMLRRADALLAELGLLDEPEQPEEAPEEEPAEEPAEEPVEEPVEEPEEISPETAEEPALEADDGEALADDFFDDSRLEAEEYEQPEPLPDETEAEIAEEYSEDEHGVLRRADGLLAEFGLLDEPEESEETEEPEAFDEPEAPEESSVEEPVTEETVTEESASSEQEEAPEEISEPSEESAGEEPEAEEEPAAEETDDLEDEEFAEYASDEVLVREESNQNRFKNSNDFFEEAPKKVIGVISSKEIEEAEEYDVIGEEEHRAEIIEQEPPKKKGEGFGGVMKKIGGGLKTFGVHCGYFATNVKRAIKRKRAMKKRKKAEEERRRKQMERRRQQRAAQQRQRDRNGLVQVRSRDDRRPGNNKKR